MILERPQESILTFFESRVKCAHNYLILRQFVLLWCFKLTVCLFGSMEDWISPPQLVFLNKPVNWCWNNLDAVYTRLVSQDQRKHSSVISHAGVESVFVGNVASPHSLVLAQNR